MNFKDYIFAILEYLRKKKEPDPKPVPIPDPPRPVPDPTPEPPKPEPPKPPDNKVVQTTWKEIIHHYNPMSFAEGAYEKTGQGVSIIFCYGDHYDAVTFDKESLRCHNRNDEGRDVWTNVDFRGRKRTFVSGEVLAVKKGVTYKFAIPPGGRSYMDYKGICFGKRG